MLTAIGQPLTTKLDLVYDGEKNQFDPAPLLQIANKQQLIFLMETTANKKAAFWLAAKPEINPSSLFGTYYPDKSKQSILLGLNNRSVHPLEDENCSVGFGK
jgi:hypothetical protein